MKPYKEKFDSLLWVKTEPNNHEKKLFQKGQFYIAKLAWIPGIEMIAIGNSLSMYATHQDSDIDLFIITQPHMLWFVRFFVTLFLWKKSVWRKGKDIRENFCLWFFISTESVNLSKIAIKDDIYLYYWIYYLKPIYNRNNTYENFLNSNNWVQIEKTQKKENLKYVISPVPFFICKFFVSIKKYFRKEFQAVWSRGFLEGGSFWNLENRAENRNQNDAGKIETFGTFSHTSTWENNNWKLYEDPEINSGRQKYIEFYKKINQIIRFFLLPKTQKNYLKLWSPDGVIISDTMLKFHDQDKRKLIRDRILENNFDK